MKLTPLFVWLCLVSLPVFSQSAFHIDSLPADGVRLDKNWKWHLGDNQSWAKPDFDDSRWDTISPIKDINLLDQLPQQSIGWLRVHLSVSPALRGKMVSLDIQQVGASELFLNGKLIFRAGKISAEKRLEIGSVYPYNQPISLDTSAVQVIAVRYAFTREQLIKNRFPLSFFRLNLKTSAVAEALETKQNTFVVVEFILFGVFLALGLLQLLLYATSTEQRTALLLGLFLATQSIVHLLDGASSASDYLFKLFGINNFLLVFYFSYILFIIAIAVSSFFYLLGIYEYFGKSRNWFFGLTVTITFSSIPMGLLLGPLYGFLAQFIPAFIIPFSEILRVGLLAVKRKQPGAKLFTLVHSITLFVFIAWTVSVFLPFVSGFLAQNVTYLFSISFLGLSLAISLLLAQERAAINKTLRKQLLELDNLSKKTIAQEQEKQQLLATQNERLEQQVEARTAELKASQTQLIQKEKLASLGELTAGIAHEIQNPLNFVNNFSEVSTELVTELEEEQSKPERDTELEAELLTDLKQNLKKIMHHGGRASSIVKGMLEHSRTESGERRSTDLNALADEYLKIAYHGLKAKDKSFNCELVTDFDSTLKPMEVAPQEIGRVLLNLYNNAFYAVHERAHQRSDANYQPKVEVRTQRKESGVEIRVKDNGTGISESVKAKIFQPFFTTKPTGEGTGLGLSLSYDIITKGHGGTLTVESTGGSGTEFVIILPTT
ncbi:histidine kinase [Spirosoma sp. HMF4905]|uniref:histidine kinase n=1 Tax=Spirosoma arboris TaxID=2682092 RepID=A0A7K1SQM3_9BACT|nr:ATP-binding protein [Spirosoma arboris]MVM35896.1 histidine kinase [Spirosoma arboris]